MDGQKEKVRIRNACQDKMMEEQAFSRSGSVPLVEGQEKELELDDTCHGHDEEKAFLTRVGQAHPVPAFYIRFPKLRRRYSFCSRQPEALLKCINSINPDDESRNNAT